MIENVLEPFAPLLTADGVSEVMLLPCGRVDVERHGRMHTSDLTLSPAETRQLGLALAESIGSDFSPLMNGSLPTGERFQWTSPPVTLAGSTLTIRVQARRELSYADFGIDQTTGHALSRMLSLGKSLIVSGGTKSGKTSLTKLLLKERVFQDARCILIEDQAELDLPNSRSIRLQYDDAYPARAMMRAAVRMRPDHIVMGEVRDAEAFELLQVVNTGHASSICTVHANKHGADVRLADLAGYSGRTISPTRFREAFVGVLHVDRNPLDDTRTTTFIEWTNSHA